MSTSTIIKRASAGGQTAEQPEKTTLPIERDALWQRIPFVIRRYGLSRGVLYSLIRQKKIQSVCLRSRGGIRGSRCIFLPSVDALFAGELKKQMAET